MICGDRFFFLGDAPVLFRGFLVLEADPGAASALADSASDGRFLLGDLSDLALGLSIPLVEELYNPMGRDTADGDDDAGGGG